MLHLNEARERILDKGNSSPNEDRPVSQLRGKNRLMKMKLPIIPRKNIHEGIDGMISITN